jgi:acyl carrier protein
MDITKDELEELFRETFEDDSIVLSRELTHTQIDSWDSMRHLNLMLALEERLGVRFSSDAMARMESVGDIVDHVSDNGVTVSW